MVAIISGGKDIVLPEEIRRRLEGFRLREVFDTYEGVFSYRTTVSIYERDASAYKKVTSGVSPWA